LQAKGAKRQYMEVARSLKLYGYLVFRPAICDYPEPHTRATLALGRAALNMRLYTPSGEIKEIVFKVSFTDVFLGSFS
jgi:sorting nexin-17